MEYQETIKAAAKRMCEQLQAKGVQVKHTQMLEALAEGFGLDSWRELKAVIDAPRAPVVPEIVVPPLGTSQMWVVNAIYAENNQQYGTEMDGRTPLEAAICTMIERLTDFGLELYIVEVNDCAGNCQLSPSYITEITLDSNLEVLQQLYAAASVVPLSLPQQEIALRWLATILKEFKHSQMLDDLTDWDELETAEQSSKEPGLISEEFKLTPTDALHMLCTAVENHAGGVVMLEKKSETLAKQLYQVRAICDIFGALVDHPNISPLLDIDFE